MIFLLFYFLKNLYVLILILILIDLNKIFMIKDEFIVKILKSIVYVFYF